MSLIRVVRALPRFVPPRPTNPRTVPRRHKASAPSWPPPSRPPQGRRFGDSKTGATSATQPSRRTHYLLYGTIALGGIYIATSIDRAPFTRRLRLLAVSRAAEHAMGATAYEALLTDMYGRVLPASHPYSLRARRVVARLAATARLLDASLCQGFQWSLAVADVPEPNAMCAPGGRVLITVALLDALPTDDHLAIVLAHEVAHALNRHGAEALHLQRLMLPFILLAAYVFDMTWLPSILANTLLTLPYGRRLEHEADTVGLLLCAEACYDPRVAPEVFRTLERLEGEARAGEDSRVSKIAPFFSTHPQNSERASRLSAQLPERVRRYEDKCAPIESLYAQVGKDFADGGSQDW